MNLNKSPSSSWLYFWHIINYKYYAEADGAIDPSGHKVSRFSNGGLLVPLVSGGPPFGGPP